MWNITENGDGNFYKPKKKLNRMQTFLFTNKISFFIHPTIVRFRPRARTSSNLAIVSDGLAVFVTL